MPLKPGHTQLLTVDLGLLGAESVAESGDAELGVEERRNGVVVRNKKTCASTRRTSRGTIVMFHLHPRHSNFWKLYQLLEEWHILLRRI